MINELIEQIGGREALEDLLDNPRMTSSDEAAFLARALLAVLDAKPVAYMHRSGQVLTRSECCDDKVFAICCKVETPLYSIPPAASVPDGYCLVNKQDLLTVLKPSATATHGFAIPIIDENMWKAAKRVFIAAVPAPGGE